MSRMIDWSLRVRRLDKSPFACPDALLNQPCENLTAIPLLSDESEWELAFVTSSLHSLDDVHTAVLNFCKEHREFIVQLESVDDCNNHCMTNYHGDKFEYAYGRVVYPEMIYVKY